MRWLTRIVVGTIGFGIIDWSYGFADHNVLLTILGVVTILLPYMLED